MKHLKDKTQQNKPMKQNQTNGVDIILIDIRCKKTPVKTLEDQSAHLVYLNICIK